MNRIDRLCCIVWQMGIQISKKIYLPRKKLSPSMRNYLKWSLFCHSTGLNLLAQKEGQTEVVVTSRIILSANLKFVRRDQYIFANVTQNFTNLLNWAKNLISSKYMQKFSLVTWATALQTCWVSQKGFEMFIWQGLGESFHSITNLFHNEATKMTLNEAKRNPCTSLQTCPHFGRPSLWSERLEYDFL